MADDAIDPALIALFAAPAPTPDPAFVWRIECAVRADRALQRARARAWRQFGGQALATATIALLVATLWRAGAFEAGIAGPGWAAITMLTMLLALTLRPVLRET